MRMGTKVPKIEDNDKPEWQTALDAKVPPHDHYPYAVDSSGASFRRPFL